MWPSEWDELEDELCHVTAWRREHIHHALTLAWAEGRPIGWVRMALLASDRAVDSYERSLAKIRQAVDLSPDGALELVRRIERFAG